MPAKPSTERTALMVQNRIRSTVVAILAMRPEGTSGSGWVVGSGFFIAIDEQWFLLTADHVLRKFLDFHDAYPAEAVVLRHSADPSSAPIDIRFDDGNALLPKGISLAQLEAMGNTPNQARIALEWYANLDLAIYMVGEALKAQLQNARVLPFVEGDLWGVGGGFTEAQLAQARHLVAGYPGNDIEFNDSGQLLEISLKTLDIRPTDTMRSNLYFEPAWNPELHQGSVQGMSGGPVFSVINGAVSWFGILSAESTKTEPVPGWLKVSEARGLFTLARRMKQASDYLQANDSRNPKNANQAID